MALVNFLSFWFPLLRWSAEPAAVVPGRNVSSHSLDLSLRVFFEAHEDYPAKRCDSRASVRGKGWMKVHVDGSLSFVKENATCTLLMNPDTLR